MAAKKSSKKGNVLPFKAPTKPAEAKTGAKKTSSRGAAAAPKKATKTSPTSKGQVPSVESATFESIELKISLADVKPEVWRRVVVPSDLTLMGLAATLNLAMGWQNEHLFEFVINGATYTADPDGDDEGRSADSISVHEALDGVKSFRYGYDFGDGWEHNVTVEKRSPLDLELATPYCIGGENACPPENCGGPHGYAEFLKRLKNPKDREHRETLLWIGGYFSPTTFDPNIVNILLREFWDDIEEFDE